MVFWHTSGLGILGTSAPRFGGPKSAIAALRAWIKARPLARARLPRTTGIDMRRAVVTPLKHLLLAGLFVVAGVSTEALATPIVGSTQVVVRDVEGHLAATIRVLVVNDNVSQDEEIITGTDSATRIEFRDGTNLTMGQNSRIKLTKVVFDPDPAKSKVVMTAVAGVFRFVSGALPSNAYEINTPVATIGVRGTTIEFSVDPASGETIIAVIRGEACIRPSAITGVIMRSYYADAVPFSAADIGQTIKGGTTGDTGTVVEFDERYGPARGVVFVQPDTPDDLFDNPTEDYLVIGGADGVFTQTLGDCAPLEEGAAVTVGAGILSQPGLAPPALSAQTRDMTVLVILNQEEEPVEVTAAGPPEPGPPEAPEPVVGPLPPPEPLPPPVVVPPPVGPGGGGGFIVVPNVIGLTLGEARLVLAKAGLQVGEVIIPGSEFGSLGSLLIRPATAAPPNESTPVCDQIPPPGTEVDPEVPEELKVTLILCVAAIPEPATLYLFAVGLVLLGLITWWRRRKSD